jgi:hypothetical protein
MADATIDTSAACTKRFSEIQAQQIKFDLQKNNPEALTHFEADANDRTYHPDSYRDWKRRSLSIELRRIKCIN